MKLLIAVLLFVSTSLATSCVAIADSSSIGLTMTSDRNPDNFAIPKSMKYKLSGEHEFNNGLILGGSFQYTDPASSKSNDQNLEGTIGYSVPLNVAFSLNGSAGIGGRWEQNPSTSFPYYVFRVSVDFAINQDITWDLISFRYRDAFDSSNNYHTPQLATGLTFTLDAQSSVSVKIMHNWGEGEPSSTGASLGFKTKF
ncbi:MAG: outer membrane beta-barrel protein [Pseudolabrys sp.]